MLILPRSLRRLLLVPVCAVPLHAVAQQVHPVTGVPDLKPLTLSYVGRVLSVPAPNASAFGGQDLASQWPGAYFRASFRGSRVFFRVGKSEEILHLVVDGKALDPLVKPSAGVYEIEGLSDREHELSVLVATESQAAPNVFGGVAIPASEQALTVAKRSRKIEFIGDSHTVGYGNLSPKHACSKDEVWADTDDTSAFGAITAAHYDADYQVNAISGRGVVRNYDGFAADTLLQAYPYVLLDHAHTYADPAWKPQVLVIALGTNDFSTDLRAGEPWKTWDALHMDFRATYVRFLQQLRADHPNALLIVWATNIAHGEVEEEAKQVVQKVQKLGDSRIHFVPVDNLGFGACDGHPSLADEQILSHRLIEVIDAEKQVWP